MEGKDSKPEQQSPADIAREAFRRLAARRIAPTPDAYREVYEEVAGISQQPKAEQILAEFAASLAHASEDVALVAVRLQRGLKSRDWDECIKSLNQLSQQHLKHAIHRASPAPDEGKSAAAHESAEPPPLKSRSILLVDPAEEKPRKESFPLVDDKPLEPTANLPAPSRTAAPPFNEINKVQMLRDLLTRTLTLALGSLLRNSPDLVQESESLAASIKAAHEEHELLEAGGRLKQLCFKIELKSEDMAEEHELLLRLFNLLLENVSELLDDDSWLSGQIETVQTLLNGQLTRHALEDATRSLKEVIYKQGLLKHSLAEAQSTVRNMMMTFIDRLGSVAASTSDFHARIDQYTQKIQRAKGIVELNTILENMMRDTRAAQTEAMRSHDDMVAARREVQDSEARIHELETQLEQLSDLVREDQLTGSLNRRGLDDVFEREAARAERRGLPLCVALLDLDDFKRLNDTHGHAVGDEALIHLVRVIKDTLRTMDVIGRFGGEEFLIVLPDTPLEDAIQTVTRLQRELTKRIFMHNNERLLITFSAGVALRTPDEDQAALIKRADDALYKAKRAGKNRVVVAGNSRT